MELKNNNKSKKMVDNGMKIVIEKKLSTKASVDEQKASFAKTQNES